MAAAGAVAYIAPWKGSSEELRLYGTVEIQEVRLASRIGGRVAEVLVRENEVVQGGQELVRLDAKELVAQLEQARAKQGAAEARFLKADRGQRTQEVYAAEAATKAAEWRWKKLEAGSRDEEKDQAAREVDLTHAEVKLAREELARAERTLLGSASAKADYDLARADLERAAARHAKALAGQKLVNAGPRKEEVEEARQDHLRLKAAHDLLLEGTRPEELDEARAQLDEARGRVRELEALAAETVVRAPERAVVDVVGVRPGDTVSPNATLVRVQRAADLWVKAYVPETDLGKVRLGQAVHVTVDSHPGRRFAGEVAQIAGVSEFTPRNVQSIDERRHQVFGIKVRVEDPEGVFKSGMAAQVFVPLGND